MTGPQLEQWYARERDGYLRAAHLFAFCEETRDSLVQHYGVPAERVTVTGAGANVERFPEIAPGPREPVILFIGNDWVRKGGRVLLQAFAKVRAAIPAAQLVLVGTDPPDAIDQPGVQVLGRVRDRAAIARLYGRAAVFAMPSYFDPFPLVLLEAMGFGVPVVASRSCGIPEIVVDGETGALVDAGDVDALARELVAVLADPARARAMGLAGRARVEERFSWDAVVQRMDPALQASWTA
nr:glycosyltransferase family 4 protein [Nakamurella flavida]